MSAPAEDSLQLAGRAVWDAVTAQHELTGVELVLLLEACRTKDRLDRLDAISDPPASVVREIGQTAILYSRLVASLRLPDQHGRRPRRRGGARGVYRPRTI